MKPIDELSEQLTINDINSNYKADVLAACLVEAGYDTDQILLSRKTCDSQGFLRDIENVSVRYSNVDDNDLFLRIQTGRKGIYDALPEGLFYIQSTPKNSKNKAQVLEDIGNHRLEEGSVRRFFSLFEAEIDRTLIELQTLELKYDKNSVYRNFTNVLLPYWDTISSMTRSEALRFVKVVPHVHAIRGSYKEAAAAISFVLSVPVEIKVQSREVETELIPSVRLHSMTLGENSILSGSCYRLYVAEIAVGRIDSYQIESFLSGNVKHRIVCAMAELLIEEGIEINITIRVQDSGNTFVLAGPESHVSRLGINTYL